MPQWDEIIQDPMVIAIAGAVLIVIVVALVLVARRRRRRRDSLQRRFGAEYERTVREGHSRKRAEQDLEARREQRDKLELRPLKADERDRYRARFEEFQASFVDAPADALRSVDNLIDEVADARGYEPVEGTSRMGLISVDHPEEVAAHQRGLSNLSASGQTKTEDLRQALLNARSLLERLVSDGEAAEAGAAPPPRTLLGLDEEEDDEPVDHHDGSTAGSDRGVAADDGRAESDRPVDDRAGSDRAESDRARSDRAVDDHVQARDDEGGVDERSDARDSAAGSHGVEPEDRGTGHQDRGTGHEDRGTVADRTSGGGSEDRVGRDSDPDRRVGGDAEHRDEDRTLSSHANEDGHVARTMDLTAEERSPERG